MIHLKKPILLLLLFSFPFVCLAQTGVKKNIKRGYQPALIRGPYLQVAGSTGIMVRWRTDEKDKSIVRYGNAPDKLDKQVSDNSLVTEHMVKISGLEPSTRYYYLIADTQDTLQYGPDNYFTTLPKPGEEGIYRIGAFGDCGNNSVNQRDVRDQFMKYLGKNELTSWILLGDNAYGYGKDAEFQTNFFNVYKDDLLKKYPLYPTPGNHDYHDRKYDSDDAQKSGTVAYYQNFSVPSEGEAGGIPSHTQAYYAYDIGNIHFLSLDSHGEENGARLSDTTSKQVQWAKKDLEANKNKAWIIAYWHHPPYTMGSHNSDNQQELASIRQNFIPILERYGVDLVLCGHSHDYERSKLMAGHYGPEASFDPVKHNLSTSSGKYDGSANSCPYIKDAANRGTVYVVSGSAGQLGGTQASFPHEALPFADATHGGALLIEINGTRLDLNWICADGVVRDHFTMMKNVNKTVTLNEKKGAAITLTSSYVGKYHWSNSTETTRSIVVHPPAGDSNYTVTDPSNCLKDVFRVHISN